MPKTLLIYVYIKMIQQRKIARELVSNVDLFVIRNVFTCIFLILFHCFPTEMFVPSRVIIKWKKSINREWDSLFETHTHSKIAHEWERSISHKWDREQLSEIIFVSLGFTFSFGAHSISEEVARFSPLWFPQGKLFVYLVSCDYLCACYSLW